jgi:hypothetical protein
MNAVRGPGRPSAAMGVLGAVLIAAIATELASPPEARAEGPGSERSTTLRAGTRDVGPIGASRRPAGPGPGTGCGAPTRNSA